MIKVEEWKEKKREARLLTDAEFIGEFTLTADSVQFGEEHYRRLDERMLAGKCRIDLNAASVPDRPQNDATLRGGLAWILEYVNRDPPATNLNSLGIDFVCHASLLQLIAATPYKPMNGWQVYAVKFENLIFIEKVPGYGEVTASSINASGEQQRLWDQVLKRKMTNSSELHQIGDAELPFLEQCEVIRRKLGDISLLSFDHIDCMDKAEKFVQFKALRSEHHIGNGLNGQDSLDCWISAHLSGVKNVVVGRGSAGIVREVKIFETSQFREFGKDMWDGVCVLDFLYTVLHDIKEQLNRTLATGISIKYFPEKNFVTFKKIPTTVNCGILPETFTSFFDNLTATVTDGYSRTRIDISAWQSNGAPIKFSRAEIVSEFTEREGVIRFGKHLCPRLNSDLIGRECNLDLNAGLELFEQKDLSKPEHMYCLLNWITEWTKSCPSRDGLDALDADFFCRKSLLRLIGLTALGKNMAWQFGVIKYRNVHFLCEFRHSYSRSSLDRRILFFAQRFEQYMTSATDEKHFRPVTNVESFFVMMKRRLGSLRLLFRSQVDCFDEEENQYVELKAIDRSLYGSANARFRKRAASWWLQSYLAGVERILCGVHKKNDMGIIEVVETLFVDELPKFGRGIWDSRESLPFIHAVLSQVKIELGKVPELTEMIVEYNPVKQFIEFRKADVRNDHYFLPDEFIKRFAG